MLSDTYVYYKIIIINNILLMYYKDIKIMIYINHRIVNDLQDKPEGLDVSVLPIGSVSGLPVAPHPYG